MGRFVGKMGVATDLGELQSKLWETADLLRADSEQKPSKFIEPF